MAPEETEDETGEISTGESGESTEERNKGDDTGKSSGSEPEGLTGDPEAEEEADQSSDPESDELTIEDKEEDDAEQFSGSEPDESPVDLEAEEEADPSSDPEADELTIEDKEEGDAKQFSGSELDEFAVEEKVGDDTEPSSGTEGDASTGQDMVPAEEEKSVRGGSKPFWQRLRPGLPMTVVLFLVAATPLLYFSVGSGPRDKGAPFHKVVLPEDHQLLLDMFVIPFKRDTGPAFASFGIALHFQGESLRQVLDQERYLVRRIIYDALREEIDRLGEAPSPEALGELVLTTVNRALPAGRIQNVKISGFSVL